MYIHCIIHTTHGTQPKPQDVSPASRVLKFAVCRVRTDTLGARDATRDAGARGRARRHRDRGTVPASECSYRARMLLGAQPTCSKQFGAVGQPVFLTSMFL